MDLIEIYKPEFIKVGLEAADKEEVFEELANFFCRASGIQERKEILRSVRERENKMSTGIRSGIAIPHGRTNAVSCLCGAMGISQQGIDYDSLDAKPVHLVFLLLGPEHESEEHLLALKRLAQLLDNPLFYGEMISQTTPEGAWAVLKKYEDVII